MTRPIGNLLAILCMKKMRLTLGSFFKILRVLLTLRVAKILNILFILFTASTLISVVWLRQISLGYKCPTFKMNFDSVSGGNTSLEMWFSAHQMIWWIQLLPIRPFNLAEASRWQRGQSFPWLLTQSSPTFMIPRVWVAGAA